MKNWNLRELIFLALCSDLGLFSKKLIGPAANVITDALHIPGGVGTSFSLMFLVIAAMILRRPGCAAIMGAVQSVLAVSFGMVGSMGALSPIGYIVPGVLIDVTLLATEQSRISFEGRAALSNALAAAAASLTANLLVFHLWGPPLWLYLSVALTTGTLCGILGSAVVRRILPLWRHTARQRGGCA